MWLGVHDPVASMEGARAADPERAALSDRLNELWAVFQDKEFTAADVLQAAEEKIGSMFGGYPELKNRRLNDAFSRGAASKLNAKTIGNQIVKDLDRRRDGLYIRLAKDDPKKANIYQMVGPKPAVAPASDVAANDVPASDVPEEETTTITKDLVVWETTDKAYRFTDTDEKEQSLYVDKNSFWIPRDLILKMESTIHRQVKRVTMEQKVWEKRKRFKPKKEG
jgi:hypothetical protein